MLRVHLGRDWVRHRLAELHLPAEPELPLDAGQQHRHHLHRAEMQQRYVLALTRKLPYSGN